ncbi:hypothetical protein RJ639_039496 [Escallonia herrerae]|uniref:Glycoside hydrolase family 28 n=1 Tax=Escallonia herrerae TaxID=1293975 RepID=A0AA89B6F6_9ASTE|nr:hypothetical protein RJ639_039496 [Escallonia herrerae]
MKSPALVLLSFSVTFFFTFSATSLVERANHCKKSRAHWHHHRQRNSNENSAPCNPNIPSPAPAPLPVHGSHPSQSNIFNVLSFGAKGDGFSDDSMAMLAAWRAACKVAGATLEIPKEHKFLINPITLQGPCMPHLVFQIDGTLLAPQDAWPRSSFFQWINIKWVHNFTIQGMGTADGQGSHWWASSQTAYSQVRIIEITGSELVEHRAFNHFYSFTMQKRSTHIALLRIYFPYNVQAFRFYASYDVTVRNIKIINSPQCHLKFDNSRGVKINNITISAPENSPNTDGIHLQNSQDVEIHHSNIACGKTKPACSFFFVFLFNSVGGLGKDRSVACVSDVIVENNFMQNTQSGVRIKTWQGGIGSVKNVTFSNIRVSDVKVPILIDQYYCDKKFCKNQTGAVAISGVKYNHIIGTYSVQPIHLACSSEIPCIDVDLIDIQLKPSPVNKGIQQALCSNSFGKSQAPLVPSSIDYCLSRGAAGRWVEKIARSRDKVCM